MSSSTLAAPPTNVGWETETQLQFAIDPVKARGRVRLPRGDCEIAVNARLWIGEFDHA